jgi:hypothetical protein
LGATHSEAVTHLRNAENSIQLLVCDGWNITEAAGENQRPVAVQNGSNGERTPAADEQPPRPNSAQEVKQIITRLKRLPVISREYFNKFVYFCLLLFTFVYFCLLLFTFV